MGGGDMPVNGEGSGEAVTPNKMLTAEATSVKLKKYTFTKETRMLLLQSVRECDAHLAAHGAKDKLFAQVYERFTTNLTPSALLRHQKPSVKTLRDKLRSMLTDDNGGRPAAGWFSARDRGNEFGTQEEKRRVKSSWKKPRWSWGAHTRASSTTCYDKELGLAYHGKEAQAQCA